MNKKQFEARERIEALGKELSENHEASSSPVMFDIAKIAVDFALCHDAENSEIEALEHLDELAIEAKSAVEGIEPDLEAYKEAIANLLVDKYGYKGDSQNYDDLANADIIKVIKRRRGMPVTLGIIWIHAARAAGLHAVGLNFPGHFLLRIGDEISTRQIIDPFHGGVSHEPQELRHLVKIAKGDDAELTSDVYETADDVDILLRLQNNIKVRQIGEGDLSGAYETLLLMRAILPLDEGLIYESGMMNYRLYRLGEAIADFEYYMQISEDEVQKREVAALLQKLKSDI